MNFIIAFLHCLSTSKKGLNRESNPDLCDADAVLYQLSYHANWEKCDDQIYSFHSAFQIEILVSLSVHIYRLIIDLLPVGQISQLVEHCTGIAEVRV